MSICNVTNNVADFKASVRAYEDKGFSPEVANALTRGDLPRTEREMIHSPGSTARITVPRYFIWKTGTAEVLMKIERRVSQVALPAPVIERPRAKKRYRRYVWRKPVPDFVPVNNALIERTFGAAA